MSLNAAGTRPDKNVLSFHVTTGVRRVSRACCAREHGCPWHEATRIAASSRAALASDADFGFVRGVLLGAGAMGRQREGAGLGSSGT